MKVNYANGQKDQSSKELSVEGEDDRRHALQRLLSNTVADAEDDVNRNGRQVGQPKGRTLCGVRDHTMTHLNEPASP